MTNFETDRQKQVYAILLTPIVCDKKYQTIHREGEVICSGENYVGSADEDMSDFSIGFYEIVYDRLLSGEKLLDEGGLLKSSAFAGDTMNSFNTVANRVPGAGKSKALRELIPHTDWPDYLQEYEKQYHCLANFWLVPREVGRELKTMSKATKGLDYMDRFLKVFAANVSAYEERYPGYFEKVHNLKELADIHFITGSYINDDFQVVEYSTPIGDGRAFIEKAEEMMRKRAEAIARSAYCDRLWDYFNGLKLL